MSVVTSVSTVVSKKLPPRLYRRSGGTLAAGDDLGALLDGVDDVRLGLLDRLYVDEWPDHRARLEPVGHLHRTCGLRKTLRKGVVDAVLHQNAVGAHTGMHALRYLEAIEPLTAISIPASSKTMNGALPPSSSKSFLTVPGHCCIRNLLTSVEPVEQGRHGGLTYILAFVILYVSPHVKKTLCPL